MVEKSYEKRDIRLALRAKFRAAVPDKAPPAALEIAVLEKLHNALANDDAKTDRSADPYEDGLIV